MFNPAAAYMPVLYAPAALALGVARATNQPIWVANAWARIAMLGISLVAIGLALVIARAGVKTFCAVALLPMSLAQFGSVNLDSMTIGFGMLLVAFMTAGVFGGPAGVRPSFWVQCSVWLLLGLLIATKPIFAAMLLPIAAWSIRKGQRKRLWTAALVLVPLLLWTAHVSASFVDVRVLIDGSALMRMTGLVMDPLLLIEMLVNSFRLKSEFYGASMIGVLGWLDTWLPSGIYLYATLLLAAALVGDALSRNAIRPVDRGLLAAAFPAFVLTTMVILWAAWTPVGAEAIEGVQGRYFLPVLPLLACVLGARHSTDREVAATTAFTLAIVLYSAGLAWDLPRVLIYRYWL